MEASIQPPTVDAVVTTVAAISMAATTATAIPIAASTAPAIPIPAVDAAATIDTPIPAVDAAATTAPIPTVNAAAAAAPVPAPISTPAPAVDAAATTAAPIYPTCVLLEKEAYYKDCDNATTAEAMTSTDHIVKVTFVLADPPAVSYFCVHGPKLEHKDFLFAPRVVFSDKDLVLLRFGLRPRSTTVRKSHPVQYFVYKAVHGKPFEDDPTSHRPNNTTSYPSILPFEDEDGNFLVADLTMTSTTGHYYLLHIFSSKTKEWTTRPLELQASPATTDDLPSLAHKVIALGAGTIGWIDLWRGIVICNVFDSDPVLRFIPLPKPEFNFHLKGDPQQIRDVTCCNGFIKFIEMEHYPRPASFYSNNKRNCKTTKDLDSEDVLYDSDLFFHSLGGLESPSTVPITWKIRTCYRHISWNLWCKGHAVHVDDILVHKPSYYMMLPELWDDSAGKFTLRNLTAVCPTLDIHGGDVVYLVSKVGIYDKDAWVIGVDLRKKTVEVLEPYCAARSSLHQTAFLARTFSGYLNATPRSSPPVH
ncbi:uncharacterized protein [Lolium perenne]|uniref:uncharacterized protein n=1 Tax=Lolium perenne TaxID=4522 RepID=UPI0021F5BEDE|nr:uncharacterized protein LOC127296596 [Lolium perenne]XP_051182717.1 uncharacterized protein LOC127296596 [Lolium perenne]